MRSFRLPNSVVFFAIGAASAGVAFAGTEYPLHIAKLLLDGLQVGAVVYGVYWARQRFWLQRSDKAAVEIDVDLTISPHSGESLVFFDCVIANKGRVVVTASPREPAWPSDGAELLQYGGSLLVRGFTGTATGRYVDWFGVGSALEPVSGLGEVNLLGAYTDPRKTNADSFWLEPGEKQHCGASVLLPAGVYVAKVTFVGTRGWDEFWTRMVQFEVPPSSVATGAAIPTDTEHGRS